MYISHRDTTGWLFPKGKPSGDSEVGQGDLIYGDGRKLDAGSQHTIEYTDIKL